MDKTGNDEMIRLLATALDAKAEADKALNRVRNGRGTHVAFDAASRELFRCKEQLIHGASDYLKPGVVKRPPVLAHV